jgi:ribosomal protein L30E
VDAFIKEVSRVLKPGGYFSWVDLRGKDMVAETESAFNLAELNLIHNETITKEVIRALDEIHERKMIMIADNVPKVFQTAFRDFAGVKDSKIYNAFQGGNAVYLAKAFQKVTL